MLKSFVFRTQEEFNNVSAVAEAFYKTIGEVWCPYFREKVAFNIKGWKHLKYKADGKCRLPQDQYARLKLIRLAPTILECSRTVQGIARTEKFEEQTTNKRQDLIFARIIFYEFVAIVDDVRAKVIVKEVVGGKKYFWSIMPFWTIDRRVGRKILSSRDITND